MTHIKRIELTKLLDSFKYTTNPLELREIKEKIYKELEEFLHKEAFTQFFSIERLTKNNLEDYINAIENNNVDKDQKDKMFTTLKSLENLFYIFPLK